MGHVTDSAPSRNTPANASGTAPLGPPAAGANRPLARLARETTPDNPWPLRLLSTKIDEYVNKMTFVWVEGQIVQFNRRPGSGMQYLTLRDADADMSMSVSVFTRELAAIEASTGAQVTEGARVVVHAKPRFWTKRGSLELRADDIRPVGIGDLLARIEQLRRVLAAEGLFDAERKHPLPFLPRKVGLVCGRNAKAKDDVIVNARLRWAGLPFEIREVAVQGAQAVREVTAAIRELDADPLVDVIVVARGGGAVEDLLPFSDEGLVRAAAAARTPIVSAIGHETDCPLLDLVADYRASTPTDAARRIVPDLAEETMGLDQARERMRTVVSARLDAEQRGLDQVRARPVLADPTLIVRDRIAELDLARDRMRRALSSVLSLAHAELHADHARLRALSPQGVLDRGYAILRSPGGGIITSAQQLSKGDLIEGVLAQGRMVAQVVGTTKPTAPSS
ncbi:exodeoxyribonuclease VII large subunit [Actinomyces sp. MRS3W]|uniref:exodeoxyribonuclease VII large subunit n=1 Tax=Actinomyces sp. MRS3W TaxID=2800796 RepID=UPI0028FD07C1|nr:exodeoxyribonuclease VII large subunit [Actinomyces sp. MRS3W]MDU0348642.1 exodeoxyribonuclease VII large subunit [Actinomyces sp. MRS3W]